MPLSLSPTPENVQSAGAGLVETYPGRYLVRVAGVAVELQRAPYDDGRCAIVFGSVER